MESVSEKTHILPLIGKQDTISVSINIIDFSIVRTYAKLFQQDMATKTVQLVRQGAITPQEQFCVSPNPVHSQ